MPQVPGYAKVVVFFSDEWMAPFSSPTAVLVSTQVAALLWAFQLRGWSCCIPFVAYVLQKIAAMRLKAAFERKTNLALRVCLQSTPPSYLACPQRAPHKTTIAWHVNCRVKSQDDAAAFVRHAYQAYLGNMLWRRRSPN
jgi:invasion protein IalB